MEACSDGDVSAVRRLLDEGRSVHETTEEGESLLSLACQAGYYELAQVLLAMRANVEDRGVKGDCTPLMEAASASKADIVRLLLEHGRMALRSMPSYHRTTQQHASHVDGCSCRGCPTLIGISRSLLGLLIRNKK